MRLKSFGQIFLFILVGFSIACSPTSRAKPSITSTTSVIRSNYSSGEIIKLCDATLASTRKSLTEDLISLAKVDPTSFENTLGYYEFVWANASDILYPLTFMGYVSENEKLRDEGFECETKLGVFAVEMAANKSIYAALRDAQPRNSDEARLKSEILLGFEKNGLSLSDEDLAQLTTLRQELSTLESEFSKNLNEDVSTITFSKAELEGLPESALKRFTLDANNNYIVTTKSTHYSSVMENAKNPATRKSMLTAYINRAGKPNKILFEKAVVLREIIAKMLGYRTWADYRTNGRMAQTGQNAMSLLDGLKVKLAERSKADLQILLEAKKQMEDPNATAIEMWDINYFANQVKKAKYNVDDEEIREYFPKDVVMDGLFKVYSTLLHVDFKEVTNADVWSSEVKMYAIREKSDQSVIGYFYTDFFPREGKYGHAAAFPLISGRVRGDGRYSLPVASIVSNFTPPSDGKPSLLTHDEVETLFHEFGHIMHQTLTRAPYASLSGSNTAQDFVEAPSQMLENWVWNKQILTLISGHYTDASKKLPDNVLNQMLAAKNFNQGYLYTRQLVLGLTDLRIHTQGGAVDVDVVYDKTYEELLGVKPLPGTHFMSTFGHMMGGYDAGYYGYIWSEVYAADMFTAFGENLLDEDVGLRYRHEILEVGHMRPELESVEKFLGRKSNSDAFYKKLGVE